MGAKTIKRIAILFATLLVVGLAIYLLHEYQVGKSGKSVLARAAAAEKKARDVQAGANLEAREKLEAAARLHNEAARLYEEHLKIFPNDPSSNDRYEKYAEVLLQGPKDPENQDKAIVLYKEYVRRSPADKAAVRKLSELLVEKSMFLEALEHLQALATSPSRKPEDGTVQFLLGRCQESLGDTSRALTAYRNAIAYGAPESIEASARLADLLLSGVKKPDEEQVRTARQEADAVIDKMVKSDPENSQVYLQRGIYRRKFGRTPAEQESAKKDLETALNKNPREPRVYIELAELARSAKNYNEARRVAEEGLKLLPNDPTLHWERALVEYSGTPESLSQAIRSLKDSVERLPNVPLLRYRLAGLMAQRGDTKELASQISELRRLNFPSKVLIDMLEARRLKNDNKPQEAIQTLFRLKPQVEKDPKISAELQLLLGQCYSQLGDSESATTHYDSSVRADPSNNNARLTQARSLAERNQIDDAIKEYREFLDPSRQGSGDPAELARVRGPLAQLLIIRNQRQPLQQRDWTEVDSLINAVKEYTSETSEWVMLETEKLLAQSKITEAQTLLDQARSHSPGEIRLWLMSAEVLGQQKKFKEARSLLDQAEKSFGDSVSLRLQRARLLITERGADFPKDLRRLTQNLTSFSEADNQRLMEQLARYADLSGDRVLETDLWSQVAKLDSKNLQAQLRLFDLAIQGKNEADIEYRLNAIEQVEGKDGPNFRIGEARYLFWQSTNTTDPSKRAKLCIQAESLLEDLMKKPGGSTQLPLMLAELKIAIAAQPGISNELRQKKLSEAADRYVEAIELGRKDANIVRRATDLIYAGRGKDDQDHFKKDLEKLRVQLTNANIELVQLVVDGELRHGDKQESLDVAQAAVKAHPNDFRASLLQVKVLIASQNTAKAEEELRQTLAAHPTELELWTELVKLQYSTKQWEKAEGTVQEVEATFKSKPLGPALCCRLLGRAYKVLAQDDTKSKQWLGRAGRWYALALNAQPNDLGVNRLYLEFLVETEQIKKARDLLERMVSANLAEPEASFQLAILTSKDGDWPKAKSLYRGVLQKSKDNLNAQTRNRLPDYLAQFINDLLQHYASDHDKKELVEAQDLVHQLKAVRPDALSVIACEARLLKANNEVDKLIELIRATAKRQDLTDTLFLELTRLTELLGQPKLAEEVLRQRMEQSKSPELGLALAEFYKRQDRLQDAESLLRQKLEETRTISLLAALADLCERMKRYQEAETLYAECVGKEPNFAPAQNNLAWLMALRDGDKTAALDHINRAIQLGGPVAELLDTRGVIYTRLGSSQNAITDLLEATRRQPTSSKLFHLAQAYLKAGKKSDAEENFAKARALGLNAESLHPLEASAYQQFLKDLGAH